MVEGVSESWNIAVFDTRRSRSGDEAIFCGRTGSCFRRIRSTRVAEAVVLRKAGDPFRYVWRDVDGSEMGMKGVCLEFARPERIVATEEFDVRWYPGEAVGTLLFEERHGLTVLTQTIRYESRAAR